jgi:hypothetical protein
MGHGAGVIGSHGLCRGSQRWCSGVTEGMSGGTDAVWWVL